SLLILICPVIEDKHILYVGIHDLHKRLVFGVRQVRGTVFFAFKRNQESVRKSFVQPFWAVVGPPLIVVNLRNLIFMGRKSFLYFCYFLLGGVLLKLEQHNVT